jgi:hypothetical protein
VWLEGTSEWTTAEAAGFRVGSAVPVPPPLPMAPPQVLAPPRAVKTKAAASANWPLLIAGGALVLVAAVAIGWIANSLINPRIAPPERIVAAAPPVRRTSPPTRSLPPVTPQPAPVAAAPTPPLISLPPQLANPAKEPSGASAPETPGAPSTETRAPEPPAPVTVPATSSVPPTQPSAPEPTSSSPPPGPQMLYQELDIQRAPKFSILGAVTAQDLHYQLLSELRVHPADEKGVRKIEQYVRDTKLLKADDLSREMFEQSLADLVGWQFTFQVNRRGDIVEWKSGPPAGRKAARVERGAELGFMVTSVMDEDGWKEMAQLSFFTPEEQTSGSQTWVRKMTHDFGALGSWEGETHYTPKERSDPGGGLRSDPLQIDYVHRMTYKPPARGIGGLPFTITEAAFKPEVAGGTFHYDTQAGRVQQVQERFLVKGTLATELLGQAAAVEMEEDQLITVRMLERNPLEP